MKLTTILFGALIAVAAYVLLRRQEAAAPQHEPVDRVTALINNAPDIINAILGRSGTQTAGGGSSTSREYDPVTNPDGLMY